MGRGRDRGEVNHPPTDRQACSGEINVAQRRDQPAATRAEMVMHRELFAVPVREMLVALIDRRRAMPVADRLIPLASERPAHEDRVRRAAGNLATVFEAVAFADWRFHRYLLTSSIARL